MPKDIRVPPLCLARDLKCLNKMYYHCETLEEYYPRYLDEIEYGQDQMLQKIILEAINMRIQCLTENSRKISDEFQRKHPVLPYASFRMIRNTISHDYEGVDLDAIEAIASRIIEIKDRVTTLLDYYEFDNPRSKDEADIEAEI